MRLNKMAENEKQTSSSKLSKFIEKNRKGLFIILICIVCFLIGYVTTSEVLKSSKNKILAQIDDISFELTDGGMSLEESEIKTRGEAALEKLAAFTGKGGVAGARANMLAADISYDLEKYEDSAAYWKAAAQKSKNTYLEPIALFNLGISNEELNKLDDAAESYKKAAECKGFVMAPHAKYSYGRVLETQGKYTEAAAVYKELNDNFDGDAWANLAKTRLLDLQINGKAE